MKNVVFLACVKNPNHNDKYGGWEWMEYSKRTWEFWCKRHNCELVIYDTPSESDLARFRVTWQRWFDVFDQVEKVVPNYNKIFMIDASSMIRWDAPNIFDLVDDRFTAWRDMDNLRWTYESVQGYKPLFNDIEFDLKKYINCGAAIINKKHKTFLKIVKNFFIENQNVLVEAESHIIKKGTDQTPFNYLLQFQKVDVNLELPFTWNARHLDRRELHSYNWQLEQLGHSTDKTPHYIKYCNIWRFTGMSKDQRTQWAEHSWNFIKDKYVDDDIEFLLNKVRHKGNEFKNATSKKFKRDILKYFQKDGKKQQILEFGCCHGDTSRIFSEVFEKVYATDWRDNNLNLAKQKCKDCSNVEFSIFECGKDEIKFDKGIDVVFIDARHSYDEIKEDMLSVLNYFDNPTIIMDDYGNPNNGMKDAIEEIIKYKNLEVVEYIGEDKGFKTMGGWSMIDREGVILRKK